MFDCPVEGCTHKCKTKNSLGVHLYEQHNKAELIKAILGEE